MLKPYDFVLTRENFLFMVRNHEDRDGQILASPKYIPYSLAKTKFAGHTWKMLGWEWSRINNPLDPNYKIQENILTYLSKYKSTGGDFLIDREDIDREFHAQDSIEEIFLEEDTEQNTPRREAKKLVSLLTNVVPLSDLGLTGSSLFRGEIDGFSDIDLVVYGSDSYRKLSSFLECSLIPEIHFRTKKEWMDFYKQYKVAAPITDEEFSNHMVNKFDQFFFNDISVSIFAVRKPADFELLSRYQQTKIKDSEKIMRVKITSCQESMFLPSIYQSISKDGDEVFIYNENRAFLFQAKDGEEMTVKGTYEIDSEKGKWMKINIKNGGFLLKDDVAT